MQVTTWGRISLNNAIEFMSFDLEMSPNIGAAFVVWG
jgi:hypothetical protein